MIKTEIKSEDSISCYKNKSYVGALSMVHGIYPVIESHDGDKKRFCIYSNVDLFELFLCYADLEKLKDSDDNNIWVLKTIKSVEPDSKSKEKTIDMQMALFHFMVLDMNLTIINDTHLSEKTDKFWKKVAERQQIFVHLYNQKTDDIFYEDISDKKLQNSIHYLAKKNICEKQTSQSHIWYDNLNEYRRRWVFNGYLFGHDFEHNYDLEYD